MPVPKWKLNDHFWPKFSSLVRSFSNSVINICRFQHIRHHKITKIYTLNDSSIVVLLTKLFMSFGGERHLHYKYYKHNSHGDLRTHIIIQQINTSLQWHYYSYAIITECKICENDFTVKKAGFHNMLLVQKLQIACHVPHINGWHQKRKNVYSKFLDSR